MQLKCLIAQAPGVIPHPLPEVNFLMVEIPSPNHIYLWSGWIDKLIAPRVEARGHPHPLPEVFFIAEYKTRPNDFDLQLVLVSNVRRDKLKKMLM